MYIYSTIIFDLDGTLFKTDTVFIKALCDVCISRGIPALDEKNIMKLIGEPMTKICRQIFGQSITDYEVECIRNEIREIEKDIIAQSGRMYDGVIEMLDKLEGDGYTLCICTNGSKQYVENVLTTFGIKEKFSIIKSRIEGLTKAQLVKQILDENACCSAIIVGDTYTDFEAADDTGCLSIGLSYGYGYNDHERADFMAHYPVDIYNLVTKVNSVYRNTAQQLIKKKIKNKPLFVGINGVDTSGKSIFTKELAKYLSKSGFKVQTVHLDDFHNSSNIRNRESDPINSYINNAFDLERIEKEILKPVSIGGLLDKELELLDLKKDQYNIKKRYIVDKDTILLIEGVLLYRDPLDKYFDFRIYIDISFAEVINRATKRDAHVFGDSVAEKYLSKYIPIQKLYIEKYNPKEKSNIVINNEEYMKSEIIKIDIIDKSQTERVKLKPFEEKYLSELRRMEEDSIAQEMLGIIKLPDLNDYMDENNKCYALLGERDEFIGIVELFNISWKNRRAELSINIMPFFRGNGYGYDAIRKILDIGFEQFGFNRIWLRVLEHNYKAIRLYERVGFTKEGVCREESLRGGRFINQIQMSILRREWV